MKLEQFVQTDWHQHSISGKRSIWLRSWLASDMKWDACVVDVLVCCCFCRTSVSRSFCSPLGSVQVSDTRLPPQRAEDPSLSALVIDRTFVFLRRAWKVCKMTAGHLSQGINSMSWGHLCLLMGVNMTEMADMALISQSSSLPSYLLTLNHDRCKMARWACVGKMIGRDSWASIQKRIRFKGVVHISPCVVFLWTLFFVSINIFTLKAFQFP